VQIEPEKVPPVIEGTPIPSSNDKPDAESTVMPLPNPAFPELPTLLPAIEKPLVQPTASSSESSGVLNPPEIPPLVP